MRIVHLSDLHVSSPHFVPEWGDRVLRRIAQLRPELLVITGDLVDNGLEVEYEQVKRFLSGLPDCDKLLVPGNHDVRYHGSTVFEREFGTRTPVFENEQVLVVGLDSSQPDRDRGHLSDCQFAHLQEQLSGCHHKYKVLALHHHVLPIPASGPDLNLLDNAGDLLQACQHLGVDLVLSGQAHRPWVWNFGGTHYLAGGTATTQLYQGGSYPAFFSFDLGTRGVLEEYNVRDQVAQRTSLPMAATRPSNPWNGSAKSSVSLFSAAVHDRSRLPLNPEVNSN